MHLPWVPRYASTKGTLRAKRQPIDQQSLDVGGWAGADG